MNASASQTHKQITESGVKIQNPERSEIERKLKDTPWFIASNEKVQKELLALSKEANGYLIDLINHKDGGGIRLLQISELNISSFAKKYSIVTRFLVQRIDKPSVVYPYEYFSWMSGPVSGSKGIMLIEKNGILTDVACLWGYKFAVGRFAYDTFGGFGTFEEIKSMEGLFKRFETELKEEFGNSAIKIKEVIPLGSLQIDSGQTNNCPMLFAAVVDGSNLIIREDKEAENPDEYELRATVVTTPISQLKEFLEENRDSYFQACILQLIAKGRITLQ